MTTAPGERDVLHGTAAGRGTATGPARVLDDPSDAGSLRRGDVLVCRTTDPSWTPLFSVAAAVVTETGGVLSHAAIVAREHGIPAVVGVSGAVAALRGTPLVTVDGGEGLVRLLPPSV